MSKKLMFILVVLTIPAFGQNPLDNLGLTSVTPAAAAYSLRKLSTSYTGNAIQVRRSSDNITQDIGFTAAGDLDTIALKTFVGSGNGFVTIWYDQSGNGRNATQTTPENQPWIIRDGVVQTTNTKPVITFSGTYLTRLVTPAFIMGDMAASVAQRTNVRHPVIEAIGPAGNRGFWGNPYPSFATHSNYSVNGNPISANSADAAINAPAVVSQTGLLNTLNQQWGIGQGVPGNSYLEGFVAEIIICNTNSPTTARQTLELNQGGYYGVAVAGSATITIHPSTATQSLCLGNIATPLSVGAAGTGITYQWYSNTSASNTGGTLIAGATSRTYTPSTASSGTLYYYVVVTSTIPNTVTSNVSGAVVVGTNSAPTITSQPSTINRLYSLSATPVALSVSATGAAAYQWHRNSFATNIGGTLIAGATSSSYTPPTTSTGVWFYYVTITNGLGCVVTSAVSGSNAVLNRLNNASVTSSDTLASAAYSLRKLSTTYAGFAIQVRRSSDNSTQNIGFTASGDLDTSSLKTFVGSGGNGFVTTWYDQSGYERNAIAASVAAQPRIVDNGLMVMLNGKPSVIYTGTESLLASYVSATNQSRLTANAVFQMNNFANAGRILSFGQIGIRDDFNANNYAAILKNNTTSGVLSSAYMSVSSNQNTTLINTPYVATSVLSPSANILNINGAAVSSSLPIAALLNTTTLGIGSSYFVNNSLIGYISEVTVFNHPLSTTMRSALEVNQGSYYGVSINGLAAIGTQPSTAAQSLCLGGAATPLSVAAAGTGLAYQWYSNTTASNTGGTLIAGATSSTYTPSTASNGTLYYYVVVTSTIPNTVTSNVSGAIVVGVTSAPAISAQPSGSVQTIACVGNAAAPLSVTATGTGLTYQWYSNTANSNAGGILIAGATGNSYTPLTNSGGMLFYYVVVANSGGCSITSAVSGAVTVANTLNNVGLTSTTLAGAAYSLRRLSSCYNGPAIKVRRSNNDSMDIGFTASGDLDTTALKAFVGVGNDGFVTTWYDQSGNGRHATQTTLGAQPSIVLSGLVQTEVGKPAIIFNGTTHRLSVPTSALTLTSNTIVSVAKSSTIGDYWGAMINAISINNASNPWLPLGQGANERHYWNGNYAALFDNDWLNRAVRTHRYDFSGGAYSFGVWRNGVSVATGALAGNWSAIAEIGIGGLATGSNSGVRGGIAQEIVFFSSALSTTDRQTLENNQGSYYGVSINGLAVIGIQPSAATQSLCLGNIATPLSVAAAGTGLAYQWYSNTTASNTGGTLIAGATSSTYTPSTASNGTLYYYVVVTSTIPNTVTSNVSGAIIVSANNVPAISAQPSGSVQTITCVGNAAAPLIVTATGTGLTYQWYSNTANSNIGGTLIAGATTNSYTPVTNTIGTLFYYVVVANSGGCTITSAVSGAVTVFNTLDNVGISSASRAGAAYSLRKLTSCYTGPAIKVRRSNNDSMDIGFAAGGGLDTVTLKTFVGSGNGFVTTWYDQSGNGRHATQATAANQPQIVNAGAVLTENGKPKIAFDGANDNLFTSFTATTFVGVSGFVVGKLYSTTGVNTGVVTLSDGVNHDYVTNGIIVWNSGWKNAGASPSGADARYNNTSFVANADLAMNNTYIYSYLSQFGINANGALVAASGSVSNTPATIRNLAIGSRVIASSLSSLPSYFAKTDVSEVIVFGSNISNPERAVLEVNQSNYYAIPYTADNVLDNLGLNNAVGAEAAHSVRKLSTTYTGNAMQIRRSNDNALLDIGFDSNGNLDTTAIQNHVTTNDGYVTIWYDQTGHNNHFRQTTVAQQPRIASAGVIDRKNGQPAIRHIATSQHNLAVSASYLVTNNPWTISVVQGLDGGANGRMLQASSNSIFGFHGGNEQRIYSGLDGVWFNNAYGTYLGRTATTNNQIYTFITSGSLLNAFNNGLQINGTTSATAPGTLFTSSTGEPSNGTMQELVTFSTSLSNTNRSKLEANQGAYYGVVNLYVSTATGGNWNSTSTWEGGIVPPSGTNADVVIATTGSNTVVLDVNTTVRSLNVNPGSIINMGSSNIITTTGITTNSGTIITSNPNGLIGVLASTSISATTTIQITNTIGSTVTYNSSSAQTVTNGITYASLTISNSAAAKTLAAGSIAYVTGDLTIDAGVTFNKAGLDLFISGSLFGTGLLSSTGGTLRLEQFFSSTTATLGTLFMAPSPNNVVDNLHMRKYNSTNNTANLILGSTLRVNNNLNMERGYITSTASNLLQMVNASTSNGNSLSFVIGPIEISTSATSQRLLPVGKNGLYGPVWITPTTAQSSTYTAQYFNGTAVVPNTSNLDANTVTAVYNNQYWEVFRTAGTSNIALQLGFNQAPNGGTASQALIITNYTGGNWTGIGANAFIPANTSVANIATASSVTNTGQFSLGYASTIVSTQSGNWNSTSTWAGGVVPSATSDVRIASGHTVTLNAAASALRVQIDTGGIFNLTTNQLSGTTAGIQVYGTVITANVNGLYGATASLPVATSANSTFFANSKVIYNAGADQFVTALTYQKLTITNSAAIKTLLGTTIVSDSLEITSLTNLNKAAQALTINGALAGLGTISSSGGSITVGGAAGRVATLYAGTISNTSLTLNRNNGTSNALVLATPLSITTLTLTNGILKTDSTNLLTLANSVIGSSSASAYINGPVRITTASTNSVLLPLGNNGMYSNVAITPTATTSTSWVVDFINNTVPNNTNIGSGLTGLGTNQYWKVSRNNSNNASFSIDFFQGAGGATSSTLRLAIYNSNWTPVSVTNSSLLANSTTGTLTTVSAVTLNAIPNSIDFFAIGFIANIVPNSILSNGSGNWSNAATWLPAQVPSAGDDVTIQNGHNVTLDVNIVSGLGPKSVTVNTGGTLSVPDGVVYNNTIFANTVLDNITAPVAAAFGLRKLRASYNGPAIRVRRNDNNAEQDIFFDAFGNLNQFTLTEFVGNASGLVTRWYDQSGNGLDFTQTTPSRQPRIVNGGEIETKNGVPAIRHVAAALQNLAMSNPLTNSTPWTVNVVQGMDGGSNARLLNGSNNWLLGFWNGFQNRYYSGNAWINGSADIATTDNQVYTAVTNGTTSVFRSGTPLTGSVSAAAPGTTLWTSGWNNGSEFSNGTVQEVILYNTSLSATDRNTLENSQSNYYINGILQSSVAGIVISGTLQIANANGLDSAIKGSPASFNTGSSLTYNGTAQNVTPINVGNITFAGSGTKTLTGLLTVSQSLTVNSGVTFNKAAQNLAINNATITNNGTMSSTGGILSLGGTGALSLGFNSLNNTVAQLQLNRTGNITLTQPLNVSTSATFTAGVLVTDATNIVTLTNAAVTGGSNTSYINGPAIVASTNITTKRVPVGKNNLLATVTITPQSATATNYAVEYFNGVGTTPNSSNLGAGLTGVATNQYWNVSRTLGTATAELSFNFNTSAGGTGSQNIALASYGTSGPWNSSVINTPILANAISGTMVGTYTQSSYGNFGIGYIANITETGLDSLSLTSATTSSLALSIRKLRSAYTGPAIRVRRSTDSLEANIGFLANGNLDTVTLKAFVGVGNNGFVTTWYDQSGNNRNAVQTTAGFQPTIVAGGTISYFNNRPTFVYDGVDDGFRVSNLPTQTDNVNSLFWIQRTTDVNYMPMNNNSGSWTMIASSGDNTSTDIAGIGSYSVSSFMINGRPTDWTTATTRGAVHTALNNTAAIVNILNQPITWNGSMVIANSWGGTWNYNGLMPEIVITNTTLDSARRVGIEISMGNYYTIGTPNNGWISTAAGGNWNTGSTWTVGTVPPDGASVVIATTNDNKVVLNVNANVGSLITNTNAILDLGNTNTIAATSGITNNGTLITAHANGLLGASASINAASITNNVGSSVTYNGSSIQTVSAITYRKLRISNSAALKNTAGAFTITDTFTIDAGATLVQANTAHALTFIGNIAGTGVIQPNATSTINITGATGGSFGTINFAASPNNSVGTFVMNRGGVNSTVTLGSSLQVNTTISLIAGNINTTNANLLIANNISTTSGSIASYVDGPVRFVNLASGNTRTAHIGKGGFLGTITVNPTSISDWTVEYFSEPATPTTPLSSSLNSLINNQYWSVTKGSNAAASATLSFFFNKPLGGNATDRIIFANYNSADVTPTWLPVILASNAFNGASSTGTVTTANALAFATGTNVNNKYTFAYAGPWQSAQTGNWKTASTWLQGSVPISGAQVTIKAGHTVTVDTTIASGGGTPTQIIIESGAQLNFDTNTFASTPITVSGVLATANALGINTSNSNGTITYNTGSTLIYNGGNQNIPTVSGVLTNLTIGGTPGSTKTLTGAITVDKLLTINTGVTFSKGSQNLTLNGTYVGNGSFTSISGNFTIGGSLGGSFGNLNLTGSVGTFTVARYGASPSVTMTTPFNATAISMQNGVLNTDATNTVTITGTSTGPGSNVAYVNGPLKIAQSTTSAITLPLGKSGVLGSVTITPTTGITSWTLEFYNGSPTVITTDGTLVSISTAQYWDIVRNSGTSTATLAFNFSQTPGGLPSQGISLAKFNTSNSLWESQLTNANTFSGNASSGTLTAPSGQNIFGNFAIGFYEGEFVSAQSGNWNSASTWVSNTIPINTSRVTIKAGHTVSLDISASPSNLTLEAGSRFNFNNNQLTSPSLAIVNSGTISTQLAAGLTGAVGASIPTGSFLMQSGSDIQYVGSTQQTVSNLAYQKLTINNGAGAVMASDITVNDSLKLLSGTLTIGSNTLLLNGRLSGSGTLKGSPTSNLTMGGSGNVALFFDQTTAGTTNRLANLTYNRTGGTITLGNTLQVSGTVTPTAGTLASNGNLILVSNASGTARIASGGCTTCSYITGNVTVQRYIPPVARRWRFLGSSVQNTTLADWQNETFVTGAGGSTNGFDATGSNAASVFSYNETATGGINNGWTAATNTTNTIVSGRGYRIFIRGDRSNTGRLTGAVTDQNAVTLDLVGVPHQGNITLPVSFTSTGINANDGWNLVANPYASPYNWRDFYTADSNTASCMKIDPTIWVLNAQNGGYSSYNAKSEVGSLTGGIIPAGASFWVKAYAASPALILKEQYKNGTEAALFKTNENEGFNIQLYYDSITWDDASIKYLTGATANFDAYDVRKLPGAVTISAYGNDGEQLAFSCRPVANTVDTIKLNVSGSAGLYKLVFSNNNMIAVADNVWLFDTYTNTVTDLKIASTYNFTIVSGVAASQGMSRFYIVVGNSSALPVKLLHFTANKTANKQVELHWATAQETNSKHFEVERSVDGKQYYTIGTVAAGGNTHTLINYMFIDEQPVRSNYYRLKQVDMDGAVSYSTIQYVLMDEMNASESLKMYPIPTTEVLTIEHTQLIKQLNVYDATGKMVATYMGSSSIETINVNNLKAGLYIVEVLDNGGQSLKQKFTKE